MKRKNENNSKKTNTIICSRSRNGTGYIRQRTDGRWEGQYYFNGERKSCYGATKEECQGKLNTILGKIYRGVYREASLLPTYPKTCWHPMMGNPSSMALPKTDLPTLLYTAV